MKKKLTIIASAEMGPGTFEAKFVPLSRNKSVDKIFIIRKSKGPEIDKLNYILIPTYLKGKWIGLLARPLYLLFYSIKHKANIILAYHIVPHAFFAYFVSLLTGKDLIVAQTGLFIQNKVQNNVFHWLMKKVSNRANYFLVPGNNSYLFWSKEGVSPTKLRILHSTIDTDFFVPDDSNKEYDFIILSRLVHEKRIDIIISIFQQLKLEGYQFKAVIVGDGDKYNELVEMVSKYDLTNEIDFVGFQTNTKLWFNKAKYYLMYSYTEGLPTSLMQAMSCGLIPVTTDVGNIPDLVDHNNGFIFPFDNREMYGNTLKMLLNDFDHKKYLEYSHNCRNTVVENHSYNSVIQKWDIIFKDINV